MSKYDDVKYLDKEFVYTQYIRIVKNVKEYNKITKGKILDEIYKIYSNPDNIIGICTTKELKYLKMLLDGKLEKYYSKENALLYLLVVKEDKYFWESTNLIQKFLLDSKGNIPDVLIDKVKQALEKVNWSKKKKTDDLNEMLVSWCKIQGLSSVSALSQFASDMTGIEIKEILDHIFYDKLFNYYVCVTSRNIEGLGEDIPIVIYLDYYEVQDILYKQRRAQTLEGCKKIDLKMFKTIFYNDFDVNNPKIKKFLDEVKIISFSWYSVLDLVKKYALLNLDRKSLKEGISHSNIFGDVNLDSFFKILDEAMDEMPSGALNGFTPNEARKIKSKQYFRQQNAHLSEEDSTLFYKIYYGLLDFTNKKYNINERIKIYNNTKIDPYEVKDIVVKFWENKDKITKEFCKVNPYNFNKEELDIASGFKKGVRDIFIISKHELDYTVFIREDKAYMVKGLIDNIDSLVPNDKLPKAFITSIIPFKDVLVYDGLLIDIGISV